jgi:hypothetical protein
MPTPLALWADVQARRSGSPVERFVAIVAGGGSAAGAAVLVKGTAVLATSAAVVGGGLVGPLDSHRALPRTHHGFVAAAHVRLSHAGTIPSAGAPAGGRTRLAPLMYQPSGAASAACSRRRGSP